MALERRLATTGATHPKLLQRRMLTSVQWPQNRRDPTEEPQEGSKQVRGRRHPAHAQGRRVQQAPSRSGGQREAGSKQQECKELEELGEYSPFPVTLVRH